MPLWFNGAMENMLGQYLAPIRADLQILKDDIQTLKNDVQIMKDDFQIMKDDIQILKGDIQILKDDVRDIKRVQCHVWKLAAKVSNVFPMVPLNPLTII